VHEIADAGLERALEILEPSGQLSITDLWIAIERAENACATRLYRERLRRRSLGAFAFTQPTVESPLERTEIEAKLGRDLAHWLAAALERLTRSHPKYAQDCVEYLTRVRGRWLGARASLALRDELVAVLQERAEGASSPGLERTLAELLGKPTEGVHYSRYLSAWLDALRDSGWPPPPT